MYTLPHLHDHGSALDSRNKAPSLNPVEPDTMIVLTYA